MSPMRATFGLICLLGLVACNPEPDASIPNPRELTREAIGHYCNMIVVDHAGPKAQIFLRSRKDPVWFSSVRDAFAFHFMPGEPKDIAVVYVNDMGRAASWTSPGPGTWIKARDAHFVIGSERRGGMGQPEPVPFSSADAAATFAKTHGGRVVAFGDVPKDYVMKADMHAPHSHGAGHAATPDKKAHH